MPKSVPPEPWNVSFRRWLGAVIADADAAVADGTDPFVTGRGGADAMTTAPASAAAGGASARATAGGFDGGVGGRRLFAGAAAYTEATTPHPPPLSPSAAGAPPRGPGGALTSPAPGPPAGPPPRRRPGHGHRDAARDRRDEVGRDLGAGRRPVQPLEQLNAAIRRRVRLDRGGVGGDFLLRARL